MTVILYIVIGFVVGLIARAIMPGKQHMGIVMTTVLGIIGSFVGGLIGSAFGSPHDFWSLRPSGWILSIVGGVLVLAIAHAIQSRHHPAAT